MYFLVKTATPGQKTQVKARLVVCGFQERDKPQSDSPTVAKESLKLLIMLAANEDVEEDPLQCGSKFEGETD